MGATGQVGIQCSFEALVPVRVGVLIDMATGRDRFSMVVYF